MSVLLSTNIQYSFRRALPSNTAYLSITINYHFMIALPLTGTGYGQEAPSAL